MAKKTVKSAAPAPDAPATPTLHASAVGTIASVQGTFRSGSDRAEWLALAESHVGQTTSALLESALAIGPSGPSTKPKTESAAVWVRWLVRKGYVTLEA